MYLSSEISEDKHSNTYGTLVKQIFNYTMKECPELNKLLEFYNGLSLERITNHHIFTELCWVIYSSGFRYDIVKKYWPAISESFFHFDVDRVAIMADDIDFHAENICRTSGFKNLRKANWCIKNAKRIIELDEENRAIGGFKGYLLSLSNQPYNNLVENAPLLVNLLDFVGIGNTTIFHLLKNLGFNIFKPDIHVRRVFSRLNIIEDEYSPITEICKAMSKLSSASGMDISELDTLFFLYGKITGDNVNMYLES